ncbi:hypothetical protein QQX98_001143 [Neonectria punicea]|uniref:Uncharacterized protein n=1 Tax=Neonectria punicea TaxID=979145 RepID=A0ABR1HQR9_9HYPO
MIAGTEIFTEEDASEALNVCKNLWSAAPLGIVAADINVDVLMQLAQGLRQGVLSDVAIDESLYRAFITCFATQCEQGIERDNGIKTAYRLTMLMVGNNESSMPPISAKLRGDKLEPAITFLRNLVKMRSIHIDGIKAWMQRNRQRSTVKERSKANLVDMAQFFWMSCEAPVKHLFRALEAERSEVEEVLQALISVDLSDESEYEHGDDDDDDDEE